MGLLLARATADGCLRTGWTRLLGGPLPWPGLSPSSVLRAERDPVLKEQAMLTDAADAFRLGLWGDLAFIDDPAVVKEENEVHVQRAALVQLQRDQRQNEVSRHPPHCLPQEMGETTEHPGPGCAGRPPGLSQCLWPLLSLAGPFMLIS